MLSYCNASVRPIYRYRNSLNTINCLFVHLLCHWYVAANCLRKSFKLKQKIQNWERPILLCFLILTLFSVTRLLVLFLVIVVLRFYLVIERERDRKKMCGWMYNRKIYLSKFKYKYNVYASPDRRLAALLYEIASKPWVYGYPYNYENWTVCTPLHHPCNAWS